VESRIKAAVLAARSEAAAKRRIRRERVGVVVAATVMPSATSRPGAALALSKAPCEALWSGA